MTINVFIGYDPREAVAYHVLVHSILSRTSEPVTITPLCLSSLKQVLTRPRHPLQSTDFSFSRFLTPYLSNYQGYAIFMDCDMLVLDDIAKLWHLQDARYAVQVVKHHHVPQETVKFLNAPQTAYEKKNWSSVILFNNARCTVLTPDYVNQASGLDLHQFHWLEDEALIGELPHRWNHLVGYDPPNTDVSLVHYTIGGPYFEAWRTCQYAEAWFAEKERMLYAQTTL
jgi:lipopolysaccharide biosynthesis glycosyltransferase